LQNDRSYLYSFAVGSTKVTRRQFHGWLQWVLPGSALGVSTASDEALHHVLMIPGQLFNFAVIPR
jgi:hypothetical protein